MSNSCHSVCTDRLPPRTHACPVNGKEYKPVSLRTVLHHINAPWKWKERKQGCYFCDDPNCEVVYFGEDDTVITKLELRTLVGIKDSKPGDLACYCFGVSNSHAQKYPDILDFIIKMTKAGMCSCDTSNPAGRCCLGYYPGDVKRGI